MSSSLKIISLFGVFWQEKVNNLFFRWNIIAILVQFALLFLKLNDLPPQLPLFYSEPWGESQLVSASTIFLLPILSLAVILINHFLAALFHSQYRLFSRILIIISLVYSLFSLISLWQIIFLVS